MTDSEGQAGERRSARATDPPAAESGGVEHVQRFVRLLRERREGGGGEGSEEASPESLYFVAETESVVRELIGFRLRGHPLAVIGAVDFPRHAQAKAAHGRPSLSWFLSKAPRVVSPGGSAPPEGVIEVFMPRVDETVPQLVERLRADPTTSGVQVDVDLIDLAFDFRFENPSLIPTQGGAPDPSIRRVVRTTDGHVLSGLSSGLYKTLRRGLRFITLANAVQHRAGDPVPLATLALHRARLAVESPAERDDDAAAHNLLFHPSAANATHLFGPAYDFGFHGTADG